MSVFPPKLVLIPVALESEEEIALARHAIEVARTMVGNGRIVLVNVRVPIDEPAIRMPFPETAVAAYREILAGRDRWADAQLDGLAKAMSTPAVPVDLRVVHDRAGVAQEVVNAAASMGADLIVMSTHSRRGIQRVFLGSVASKVSHLTAIPLLLLPVPAA